MKSIIALLEKILGFFCNYKNNKEMNSISGPFFKGYHLANNWEKVKKERGSFFKFFDDNCIKCVAIYGFGEIGQRFYEELKAIDVEVIYIIDRKINKTAVDGIKLIDLNEEFELVDAIIVTPIQFYDEIANELDVITDIDIISLAEVVEYCV